MIRDHFSTLAGFPVQNWIAGAAFPTDTIPRIFVDYDDDDTWTEKFAQFLEENPELESLPGLIVGAFDFESSENTSEIVEALVASSSRFSSLKALFIGDILSEENEISWIEQSDLSPLFETFPHLEFFGSRGGNNLVLDSPRHQKLKTLVVQSGGLDARIVQGLSKAELPALEHLELYLGEGNYGATTTIEDLQPLLSGEIFLNLKYLGLRDSEIADQIAVALQNAPILGRLEVLDLSLGILTDEGAHALLENPALHGLKKLDLHHHFCSDEAQQKLKKLPIEVDISDAQQGDEYKGEVFRYVAVSE